MPGLLSPASPIKRSEEGYYGIPLLRNNNQLVFQAGVRNYEHAGRATRQRMWGNVEMQRAMDHRDWSWPLKMIIGVWIGFGLKDDPFDPLQRSLTGKTEIRVCAHSFLTKFFF